MGDKNFFSKSRRERLKELEFRDEFPIKCTCGFFINQLAHEFNNRVHEGEDPADVMKELRINHECCRKTIMSPFTMSIKSRILGTIDKSTLTKGDQNIPIFPLGKVALPGVNLVDSGITPSHYTGVVDVSSIGTKASPSENPLLAEPRDEELEILHYNKGNPRVVGYERDENGEVILIDVGLGYKVPRLVLSYPTVEDIGYEKLGVYVPPGAEIPYAEEEEE